MPITFTCQCGKQLRVAEKHAGRQAKCPACGIALIIPGTEQAPPSSPPQQPPRDTGRNALPVSEGGPREEKPEADPEWLSQGPVLILVRLLALFGFAAAVFGFFLTWSGTRVERLSPPFGLEGPTVVITIPPKTGEGAGHYGYTTLVLAALGGTYVVLTLFKRSFHLWPSGIASFLGFIILTIVLRSDEKVTALDSVSYAIKHGDITLGYTLGPGTALIGFTVALVAALIDAYWRVSAAGDRIRRDEKTMKRDSL